MDCFTIYNSHGLFTFSHIYTFQFSITSYISHLWRSSHGLWRVCYFRKKRPLYHLHTNLCISYFRFLSLYHISQFTPCCSLTISGWAFQHNHQKFPLLSGTPRRELTVPFISFSYLSHLKLGICTKYPRCLFKSISGAQRLDLLALQMRRVQGTVRRVKLQKILDQNKIRRIQTRSTIRKRSITNNLWTSECDLTVTRYHAALCSFSIASSTQQNQCLPREGTLLHSHTRILHQDLIKTTGVESRGLALLTTRACAEAQRSRSLRASCNSPFLTEARSAKENLNQSLPLLGL